MAPRKRVSTIREQVYAILRDEISRGEYAPGTRLQEADLTEHLNVSRSPVREALRQLVADGLLIEIPNKGVYVKEFSLRDIEEIYDLRVLLESYAIFHSAGRITSARLRRLLDILADMEEAYEKEDIEAYTASDEKLHMKIVQLADNSLVNDTYERVRSMNQQFRVLSLADKQRLRESLEEHREIIGALATGDMNRADEINRRHLSYALDSIRRLMNDQHPVPGAV